MLRRRSWGPNSISLAEHVSGWATIPCAVSATESSPLGQLRPLSVRVVERHGLARPRYTRTPQQAPHCRQPLQRQEHSQMEYPRFDLTSQVALVTGAARGLGRAISLALAHAGADVALGLRDINAGGDVAGKVEAMGRRVLPLQMDMRNLLQIRAAIDRAAAHFGRVDILINNAGVAPENPAEDVREEDFDLTLVVNLKGTFFASQLAGRVMIKQRS